MTRNALDLVPSLASASTPQMGGALRVYQPRQAPVALSLRKNLSWTLAGNVISAGCQWGMLAVLAKLGSTEMLGIFVLAQAATAPALLVAGSLRGLQATDTTSQYRFAEYMGLRALALAVGTIAVAIIAWRAHWGSDMLWVLAAVAGARVFDSLSDGIYGLLQQHEKMDRIAISRIIQGVVQLLGLAVVVQLTNNLAAAAMAYAGLSALVTIFYDMSSASMMFTHHPGGTRSIWISFNRKGLASLFWLALPLALVNLLLALNNNIPRYLLEHLRNVRELGIFAAMAALMLAGAIVVTALGQSSLPRLANDFQKGNRARFVLLLAKLSGFIAAMTTAGVIGAMLLGRQVLSILYTPEYAQYQHSFVWLMVASGAVCIASIFGYALTAARFIRNQLPLFAIVTLATLLAGWVQIRGHGVEGAAQAVLIGAIVQLLGSAGILAYALTRPVDRARKLDRSLIRPRAASSPSPKVPKDIGLLQTLKCDWKRNRGNPKGTVIVTLFRIAHRAGDLKETHRWLWRWCWPLLAFYVIAVEWVLGVELQFRAKVGPGLALYHGQGLVISGKCIIGSNCSLRQGVTIGGRPRPGDENGDAGSQCPILGDGVDVGVNAIILGKIRIGDGAVIGAGAVVVKDVPPGAVVVGNPARILRIISHERDDADDESMELPKVKQLQK